MNQKNRIRFRAVLSIGDLLTACSIITALIAVLVAWSNDRGLRRHENADRIRHSAGTVIAKMERWKERSHSFYNDLLPLFADTAAGIMKHQQRTAANAVMYRMYREIVGAHALATSRIVDEQIEIAYVDLYGYDPKIKDLFAITICRLKQIDDSTLDNVYSWALKDLDDFLQHKSSTDINRDPKDVNNNLRLTCLKFDKDLQDGMEAVIKPVRDAVSGFIGLQDEDIISRKGYIPSADNVFASISGMEQCLRPR